MTQLMPGGGGESCMHAICWISHILAFILYLKDALIIMVTFSLSDSSTSFVDSFNDII